MKYAYLNRSFSQIRRMPPASAKPALLVIGQRGSGKSTFIRQEAATRRWKLFHWNARTDRTLRNGRDRLHIQVRSREPSLLWIEGVEDLTQEAQAFLRRILETATPNVLCVLESSEPWRISEPILSRCIFKTVQAPIPLQRVDVSLQHPVIVLEDILSLYERGEDPVKCLHHLLDTYKFSHKTIVAEAYRRWGSGISPWLILAWVCGEMRPKSVVSKDRDE